MTLGAVATFAGGGVSTARAEAEVEAPAIAAPPLRPKYLRWTPTPENSPKHQKGVPSPRTSPRRRPRPLSISPEVIALAAEQLHPEPGSNLERAHLLTRMINVIRELCVPNHLRGVLGVIRDYANTQTAECAWLSYADIAARLSRNGASMTPRQVINNVAELEGLELIETENRKMRGTHVNMLNVFRVTVPARLRELAAAAAAIAAAAVPSTPVTAAPPTVAATPAAVPIVAATVATPPRDSEPEPPRRSVTTARQPMSAWRDRPRAVAEVVEDAPSDDPHWHRGPPPIAPVPKAVPVEAPSPSSGVQPVRRNVEPAPLPTDPLRDPDVVHAAVVELLLECQDVYVALPDPFEVFAARIARIRGKENRSLTQVLIGLWQCSTKPGREGRELSDYAISCIQSVKDADVRFPPPVVQDILRRAKRGELRARPPPA